MRRDRCPRRSHRPQPRYRRLLGRASAPPHTGHTDHDHREHVCRDDPSDGHPRLAARPSHRNARQVCDGPGQQRKGDRRDGHTQRRGNQRVRADQPSRPAPQETDHLQQLRARRPTTRELAIGRCQEGRHPQPARVECVLNLGTRDQRLRERPGGQRHEGRRCYDSSGSTRLGLIHRSMMPPHWMSQLESTLNGRSPPLPRITVSRVDPGPRHVSAHAKEGGFHREPALFSGQCLSG